jgi:ADP-ribose pyrophosphatase YjhB (NUDIX family)
MKSSGSGNKIKTTSVRFAPIFIPTLKVNDGNMAHHMYGMPEILLVLDRKDSGYRRWRTIGGMIEAKESPTKAIRREMREETGAYPNKASVFFWGRVFPTSNRKGSLLFVGIYKGKRPYKERGFKTSEIEAVKWFPINKLPLLGSEKGSSGVPIDDFNLRQFADVLLANWSEIENTFSGYDFKQFLKIADGHFGQK